MKAHPVPQEIMSVEFKLFGNFLSLREFIFIAISVAVAWLIYIFQTIGLLPKILAYPLLILVGGGGIILGVVPYQDRPMYQWVVNFFNAISKPTQMVWTKKGLNANVNSQQIANTPVSKSYNVQNDPITTIPVKPRKITQDEIETIQKFDQQENELLTNIGQTMRSVNSGNITAKTPVQQQFNPTTDGQSQTIQTPTQNQTLSQIPSSRPSMSVENNQQSKNETINQKEDLPSVLPPGFEPEISDNTQSTNSGSNVKSDPLTNQSHQINSQQNLPTSLKIANQETPKSTIVQQDQENQPIIEINENNIKQYSAPNINGLDPQPNMINIIIKDKKGDPISKVICVIKTNTGDPVRASISNELGQIINNSPLKDGTYYLVLSKNDYNFPIISIMLTGEIYPTIQISEI
ncbi:PrgI family protein [Candidatus Dojkabacteria bacterium]|nr:PrgI family protein [Candidatus Dojkabacteria bacterium]